MTRVGSLRLPITCFTFTGSRPMYNVSTNNFGNVLLHYVQWVPWGYEVFDLSDVLAFGYALWLVMVLVLCASVGTGVVQPCDGEVAVRWQIILEAKPNVYTLSFCLITHWHTKCLSWEPSTPKQDNYPLHQCAMNYNWRETWLFNGIFDYTEWEYTVPKHSGLRFAFVL
jgi:hypothetical protein